VWASALAAEHRQQLRLRTHPAVRASIHIGDVLDIDGTTGKVSRIGIRSSTVKTFQGAEVIIPTRTSSLTKSSTGRFRNRCAAWLPVGVAYGSDVKM